MRARVSESRQARAGLFRFAGMAVPVLLATALSVTGDAWAVTLTVSNVEDVRAGATALQVPMALSNDGAVASVGGIQTDVAYDPAVLTLTTVLAGAASQDAGKHVSFNVVSSGVVRLIIAGLNQETIQDGVLAALLFNIAETAPPGSYPVAMTTAQMVSPTGIQITGSTVPGSVTIVGPSEGEGSVEGESEGEGEGEGGNQSGCSCGTLAPPHDSGNSGTGFLLAAGFLMICLGASRRERRQVSRR